MKRFVLSTYKLPMNWKVRFYKIIMNLDAGFPVVDKSIPYALIGGNIYLNV